MERTTMPQTKTKASLEPPESDPAPPRTQPVHVVRLRNIRAAIWQNDTEFGTRHNVTVSRLYKDDQQVIDNAHTWICRQVQGQDVPF
jgi:hypothetical protein